jgi:uncharacterized membrane protein YphA (DoxX/SURF4 family)
MSLIRRIARPMMASLFLTTGIDALRNPEPKVEAAETVAPQLAGTLHLPADVAMLVQVNGGIQVVAGALLALNRLPRLAALALAASLVPTTLAGHRFWEETDDDGRARQRIQFLKNQAILGGLLLAATGSDGGRGS